MSTFRRNCVLGTLLTCLFFIPASAQTNTSAIAGVVTDDTGSVLPGAAITATQVGTGQVHSVTTSANGEYVIPQLPPGRYDLKVSAKGFDTALASNVTLEIAQRARLDFTMKVGALSQEVQVTAQAAIMDTDTASLGQTISQRTIRDLPLNGRNYLTLGSLSPGVVPRFLRRKGRQASSRRQPAGLIEAS